ncbi:MAG: hypothetical protein IPK74_07440 [Deltaproteobacteria bacterium]|nr:hypothetical protein [Deltaproteobacteria bacterium]
MANGSAHRGVACLVAWLVACAPPTSPSSNAAPVEPATPSSPAAPVEPATPTSPVEPATPAAAATPVEPAAPATPVRADETPPPGFTPIPASRKGAFPGVAFTEVRAFAFDLHVDERSVCGMPLDADGTPCETVEGPGVVLTEAQTKTLLAMLSSKSTFGSGSSCFLPHHGFVFYDAAGTPVAELSLCFMCAMMVALPSLPKMKPVQGTDTYGLNEKSTARLRALCHELGLPMCDAKNPAEFSGTAR